MLHPLQSCAQMSGVQVSSELEKCNCNVHRGPLEASTSFTPVSTHCKVSGLKWRNAAQVGRRYPHLPSRGTSEQAGDLDGDDSGVPVKETGNGESAQKETVDTPVR